jgi:hypothetical protein
MRSAARIPVLLMCAGLAAACDEPLGPNDIVGTYVLQTVAGEALPAIVDSNSYDFLRVVADTLRFTADGRGTRAEVVESEPSNGGAPTGPMRWEQSFRFSVAHGWIAITFDCPPNALCAAPPHVVARPTANGLRVDFALTSRVPQTYAGLTSSP